MFGTLDGMLLTTFALAALQTQDQLLGSLCLKEKFILKTTNELRASVSIYNNYIITKRQKALQKINNKVL
jgi:hypothetical protein